MKVLNCGPQPQSELQYYCEVVSATPQAAMAIWNAPIDHTFKPLLYHNLKPYVNITYTEQPRSDDT